MEEVTERTCNTCKVVKPLTQFNKGNAAYGRKSECKHCQYLRKLEYKKKPGVVERMNFMARENRKRWPQERRTAVYESKKQYYEKWKLENPEKYRASEKSKAHTRRKRFEEAGPLLASSVIALEKHNTEKFASEFFICEFCNQPIISEAYHLEHLTPLCRRGTNKLENLAISCKRCNLTLKKKKTLEEFRPDLVEYFKQRKLC